MLSEGLLSDLRFSRTREAPQSGHVCRSGTIWDRQKWNKMRACPQLGNCSGLQPVRNAALPRFDARTITPVFRRGECILQQ
jgi:hypothetical protein